MLTELLNEEVIKVGLESEEKDEVFEELLSLLAQAGRVEDYDAALDVLMEREDQQSTGIGDGIAIPHGRMTGLAGVAAALGVSEEGIEFDAIDGKPVHVVFLLLGDTKGNDTKKRYSSNGDPRCRVWRFIGLRAPAGAHVAQSPAHPHLCQVGW